VIPASAVINNGDQQVVLIDLGSGYFRPQPVKTGMHAENYVEVLDGLNEGDRVVTSANFLIDSESNLRAALQGFAAPQSGAAP
jgi:Cu(I)/Ag(I) efflux system membrane fusion protein